jgi:hypothetical protein
MTPTATEIEDFLKGQIVAWNAADKAAFMGLYRKISPNGLDIDYVGQPRRDAWEILETMWANQNDKIELEVKKKIVNGAEAACFHRNHVRGAGVSIDTIELYSFGDGALSVRYFIEAAGPNA